MNSKYKLIILNNKTQSHYSLSINKLTGYFLLSIFIFLLLFSLFGIFRFIKPHVNQIKMNELYSKNHQIENILSSLQEQNLIDSSAKNQLALIPNNPPVFGIVTKGIINNISTSHNGIDIATKSNAKVMASQEGLVILSNSIEDYGKTIIIAHPNNYYSIYSHLNKSLVKNREYVQAKQVIGHVGQTGNSNAPHLHFEIWKNHHIIDPRNLITEYKIKDVSIE